MAPPLFQQVLAYIRTHNLIRSQTRLLVGVSGGPDSTALLHLLYRLAPRWSLDLGVAHFDHGLRGSASRAEAQWVQELAASLHLPFHLGTGEVGQRQREGKLSRQVAARQLRLQFFHETRRSYQYDGLALGHSADDQLELFFLRLLRGAGPEGLRGMTPVTAGGIIRPLLGTPKARILEWLAAEELDYRLDESNLHPCYQRNRLRLELLPRLLAYNPRLGEAVWRSQALLQEQEEYLAQESARNLAALVMTGPGKEVRLPVSGLRELHPALQKRVLRLACVQAGVPLERLSGVQVAAMEHLCQGRQGSGEVSLPGNWRLVREGQQLALFGQASDSSEPGEVVLAHPEAGAVTFLDWTITWRTGPAAEVEEVGTDDPFQVNLDFQTVEFPLRLRTFRAGDRFQPLGMQGTKKLQDFFVDAKIPRSRRPVIPLLLSREQIVWVVGLRPAETVRLTPRTRRVLKLSALPPPRQGNPEPPR